MKVLACPADSGGCGYYRLRWPIEALNDSDITMSDDPRDLVATEYDVVVFQRPLRRELVEHIPRLKAAGVAVVVEVDDDFSAMSCRNVAWQALHPKENPSYNWTWLERACAMADLVTVSTPALARRYGKHGRIAVLPNYVPSWYLTVPYTVVKKPETIAWSGSVHTHPDDLQRMGHSLEHVVKKTGWKPFIIGTGDGVQERLALSEPPEASGWLDLHGQYQHAMAAMQIGLVPLELTAFNEGKSWLKGLEFASLGVPFVASPTEQYKDLAAQGIGLIANKPKDWERHLLKLIEDEDYRKAQGRAMRQAAGSLTIEAHAWRWLEAWESAWLLNKAHR